MWLKGVIAFSGIVHLIVAYILWYFFFPGFHPLFIAFGALLPDIDSGNSFLGRKIPAWMIFKHRGILHTIWGLLFFTCLVGYFWDWFYGMSLGLGYLIHLIMDRMTPMGISWFGMKRKRASK